MARVAKLPRDVQRRRQGDEHLLVLRVRRQGIDVIDAGAELALRLLQLAEGGGQVVEFLGVSERSELIESLLRFSTSMVPTAGAEDAESTAKTKMKSFVRPTEWLERRSHTPSELSPVLFNRQRRTWPHIPLHRRARGRARQKSKEGRSDPTAKLTSSSCFLTCCSCSASRSVNCTCCSAMVSDC